MSVPVINLTTSILGYQQWQTWAYQPAATNTPSSWAASSIPPGMSFSLTTGLLTGAVTTPGVYLVNLTATNSDGASVPVMLTIGIDPASGSNRSGMDLSIDTGTGAVTTGTAVLKEDDDMMFFLTFTKGGAPIDIGTLHALNFALKEFEPDVTLVVGNTFLSLGTGAISPKYQLYMQLDSTAMKAAISSYEQDKGTFFNAVCEVEWQESNSNYPTFGPQYIRRSSQLFNLPIYRNVNPA